MNALAKNGVPPRNPQSVRFTVVACTLTSTSSSRTVGRGTSIDLHHIRRAVPGVDRGQHASTIAAAPGTAYLGGVVDARILG